MSCSSSTRPGRSKEPPEAWDREQQTARLGQAACGSSAGIRGLQNNLWEESRELGLLSLQEKAGNRAGHDCSCNTREVAVTRGSDYTAARTEIRANQLNFQERKEDRRKD